MHDNKAEIEELCAAMLKVKHHSLYGKATLLWRQGYRKGHKNKAPENDKSDIELSNAITNFFPAFQGEIGEQNKEALYQWIMKRYVKKEGKDG